ncbi:xanthine dehydrogenase family protein molybdopterin-binding subunit [Acuticoccus sp. M5D2P5]|uniref:xanthine dehydrogenase family protein molybdopterin-binding subunit n=1 Tax=Acuticoccus kalidii TaxID=2910977 RepID=UPI001F4220F0|nr:xanthine dehydrogenase family protein molybdopterin-binding subunit [Acuticoccus kalidii]MCF3936115.1 xanthine dehydrogenase family protein molybdopterin-binding subunit [Acuticoccus kalidii]
MNIRFKFDEPDTRHRLDQMSQDIIGKAFDRPDGPMKVSGQATYAAEWEVDRLAHGVLVRAPVARGRLKSLGIEAVSAMDGVIAVLTGERFLRVPAQGTENTAPHQGASDIYYHGQPVALVVAETFEAARHAAHHLALEIETSGPAPVDPEASDTVREETDRSSQGDLDRAMAEAAHTVDVTYRTPGHNSAAMEPHAAIAQWDGDELTLRGAYQMLKFNRNELADSLGIPAEKVRILAPYVGGGFGSKLGISHEGVAAALAAREIGRPVSVVLSRQQVFETTIRRSESRQRIRLAAGEDGRLTGIGHEYLVSNLPEEDFAEPVAQATPFLYAGEHREVVEELARVHRLLAGSVRAPGEAIGVTVLENAMDELAEKVGLDPVELRLRNIPDVDPSSGKPYSSNRLADCLVHGAERFGWDNRNKEPGSERHGEWLIGQGMASAVRVNMLAPAEARVRLSPEGDVTIETDMTDIGTGTYAILTQIASEMLGIVPDRIETRLGDTDFPPGPGSGGSWGAASTGTAVFIACEEIRRRIAKRVAVAETDLTLVDGHAITDNRKIPLPEILAGVAIDVVGELEPGKAQKARRQATYGAYFAEVAVNAVTGETRVRRMLGVFSAGRILNAKTARSQCLGGMTWGIGMALTEALVHDARDGHLINHDLAEYHIPVNADVPQIEVDLLDERDDWANPLQAKGIGELGICGAAASVVNAIYNATGVRVRDYPATLDKVLAGLP